MKAFISKYQVVVYFLVATIIIPFTFFNLSSPLGASKGTTLRLVLVTIIKYAPTITAVLLVMTISGSRNLKELLSRFFIWNVGVRLYIIVFSIPIVLDNLLPFFFLQVFGQSVSVTWNFSRVEFTSMLLLFSRFFFMGGGMGEEFGWRGYLTPYFQGRYTVLTSAVFIGLLWAAWHFPNYWMGDRSWMERAYLHAEKIFRAVPMAIVYAWIFNNTKGSVLLAALMHATVNTIGNLYELHGGDEVAQNIFFNQQRIFDLIAIGMWSVTALILVVHRGALVNKLQPAYRDSN